MMGGGVQDILDNYVMNAMQQVESALDDEMQRMDNLGVRRRPCAPDAPASPLLQDPRLWPPCAERSAAAAPLWCAGG